VVEDGGVEVDAAEAFDALRLPEDVEAGVVRSTAASKVPPPRSYTATMAPGSMRCCCA